MTPWRCHSHLSNKKRNYAPPQAYWNNLQPGRIPSQLQDLTQPEQRLLARITPFLKIVKLTGRYGQFGLKGQAILFAQDIFEVTENLPVTLPRNPKDSDLIIVTEQYNNSDSIKEFAINHDRVYRALQRLIQNNPLYSDVKVDENIDLDESQFYHYENNCIQRKEGESKNLETAPAFEPLICYKPINERSRILYKSFLLSKSSNIYIWICRCSVLCYIVCKYHSSKNTTAI